jgi:hypothetical protein
MAVTFRIAAMIICTDTGTQNNEWQANGLSSASALLQTQPFHLRPSPARATCRVAGTAASLALLLQSCLLRLRIATTGGIWCVSFVLCCTDFFIRWYPSHAFLECWAHHASINASYACNGAHSGFLLPDHFFARHQSAPLKH